MSRSSWPFLSGSRRQPSQGRQEWCPAELWTWQPRLPFGSAKQGGHWSHSAVGSNPASSGHWVYDIVAQLSLSKPQFSSSVHRNYQVDLPPWVLVRIKWDIYKMLNMVPPEELLSLSWLLSQLVLSHAKLPTYCRCAVKNLTLPPKRSAICPGVTLWFRAEDGHVRKTNNVIWGEGFGSWSETRESIRLT